MDRVAPDKSFFPRRFPHLLHWDNTMGGINFMPNYVEVKCEHCGRIFKKDVAHYNWAIKSGRKSFYCSRSCQINAREKRISEYKLKHYI